MKKILLETSFSKIYMIVMILITLLILGGYFSYAMFTVSKEKSNAISIVTGNLTYKLTVDGKEDNTLVVPANSSKDFEITLTNPNNRIARFNFYYLGTIPTGVTTGYITKTDINTPPNETGINLEASGTSGSSNTYLIRVTNTTRSSITIDLGVSVGLDYNDLILPSNGHLFTEYAGLTLAEVLLTDSTNNIDRTDPEQTFITGETPNNYIWYSGKLWRAVSIDPSDNSVKLVTQWDITAISYNEENNSAFAGSYIEMWLNDKTADGFLSNLRDAENFIKMDSVWNATMMSDISKPPETTMVTDPVGLLNFYEYGMSYNGTTYQNGYLNNNTIWKVITPYAENSIRTITETGSFGNHSPKYAHGIRPAINLKEGIKVVDGSGTESDPYRLEGDNDTNLNGTLLNTRYSGEYISFGTGVNNLYRIVSHENGTGTKITSAEPLKSSSGFITSTFGTTNIFSSSNTIGRFLNTTYLNPSNGYLTSEQVNMIEDNTTWYLGAVANYNYRLAKYSDIDMNSLTSSTAVAKVGLLRSGELMSSQFSLVDNNTDYWLITPHVQNFSWMVFARGNATSNRVTTAYGIKPAFNLKSNIIITGGEGTKEDPLTIDLA